MHYSQASGEVAAKQESRTRKRRGDILVGLIVLQLHSLMYTYVQDGARPRNLGKGFFHSDDSLETKKRNRGFRLSSWRALLQKYTYFIKKAERIQMGSQAESHLGFGTRYDYHVKVQDAGSRKRSLEDQGASKAFGRKATYADKLTKSTVSGPNLKTIRYQPLPCSGWLTCFPRIRPTTLVLH